MLEDQPDELAQLPDLGTGRSRPARVIRLYQILLRRAIEHFLPETLIEPLDRVAAQVMVPRTGTCFRLTPEPDSLTLRVLWFGHHYALTPGGPVPYSANELRLVRSILEVLDRRFRALYDPGTTDREDMARYEVEDLAVARYLAVPACERIPPALAALRATALSTYENQRITTGVLVLGTPNDPTQPHRATPRGAPRYGDDLPALRGLHRICDGLRSVFVIDQQGDLAWPVEIGPWAHAAHGKPRGWIPCPRAHLAHSHATARDGHVVLNLSAQQDITVFADGQPQFVHSAGRWRLMDLPHCYDAWRKALGRTRPADLPRRLFQAALELLSRRQGALLVVLRRPLASIPQLLAPEDQILSERPRDDPDDPQNLSPRLAKRILHHVVRGQDLATLPEPVLESIAALDGAVVTDRSGALISFGAILRVTSESVNAPRAIQGARTAAALAASYHGPVLKVSTDGSLAMYLGGRRIWEV